MSSGYFSVGIYGQSGLVMDWFGLNDPFTQQLPIKITNTWSGTIWVQGELISPPAGVYTVYSGVSMSGVSAGASVTAVMTWNANISGQTATSSPVTHALTLGLLAFTSSNYTGALASGNFAFNNTLFNRYSGMIKVFGDQYSNDQPLPTLTLAGGGTFASGQTMSYGISYILSGWESDVGAPSNTQITSGFGTISLSWSSIAGATQYFVWRYSGNADFTLYSGTTPPGAGTLRPMDLIYASSQTTLTDTNLAVLSSGYFRHRTWQNYNISGTADGALALGDTATYLSPPASRVASENFPAFRMTHGYQLSKNVSGTNLLGPLYLVVHPRNFVVAQQSNSGSSIYLNNSTDGSTSGSVIADNSVLTSGTHLPNTWYRHVVQLGASGSLSASGTAHIQYGANLAGLQSGYTLTWMDDVFVVAQS